jgi:ribonuclease HI
MKQKSITSFFNISETSNTETVQIDEKLRFKIDKKTIIERLSPINALQLSPVSQDDSGFLSKSTPITCYTDGSSLTNGKDWSKSGYSVVFRDYQEYNVGHPFCEKNSTNNRAELLACILAINICDKIDSHKNRTLIIYSDSLLVIKSLTIWIKNWKKNNWITSKKTAVLNKDLIVELDKLCDSRNIVWKHINSHTGKNDMDSLMNDLADKLAKKAAKTSSIVYD